MPHPRIGAIACAALLSPIVTIAAFFALPERKRDVHAASPSEALAGEMVSRIAVAGRILDAEGNPVARASVRLVADAHPGMDWFTGTDRDGVFSFAGVDAKRVRVIAENDESGLVASAELGADEARHVVLVLGFASDVTGVVLDERGTPIAHAGVKSWGEAVATEKVVVADDDGRYVIRRVAPGANRLTVWARGFEPVTVLVPAESVPSQKRDVHLRASPSFRGLVVDATGQPVAAARIAACEGKELESATSDARGFFELPATSVGCQVMARHPRFTSSRPIPLTSEREFTVRLAPGGIVEGSVVSERSKPVASFSVTIDSFEPPGEDSEAVGRAGERAEELRGSFRLVDLAPGTYMLRASAEGMIDATLGPIAIGPGKVVRGVQFVLADAPMAPEAIAADGETPAEAE